MKLEVTDLPISQVHPNPWNPNRQSERQFAAEVESIRDNGFLLPVIVRPRAAGGWEIIDGEHRHRALSKIISEGLGGAGNVSDLSDAKALPSIILDLDDARAKRLTIILNETRGRADTASLAALLSELEVEFGEDLITGLPYTDRELEQLIGMGDFDWDSITAPTESDFDGDDPKPQEFRVVAILDEDTALLWKERLAQQDDLPPDPATAAGTLLGRLLRH